MTSSIFTRTINAAMQVVRGLTFGETCVNREHSEAMQGFMVYLHLHLHLHLHLQTP